MSQNFFLKNEGVQAFAPLKLRSYWTEVHQILHDVAKSSQMNLLKSELRYSTPFRNGMTTNEGETADFAHFNPKIGCIGNVP